MSIKNPVIALFLSLLFIPGVWSQVESFHELEQKVYQLNNKQKYNESQNLLLPILQNTALSNEYKYQAAILLSYTYKRVFDYESTLKFLDKARQFALKTSRESEYLAAVRAEEAFVYFDTHEYAKSDSLMTLLAGSGFEYISLENKSKLVMQQGYLRYLDKQYNQAETIYNQAIALMQASAPCHLPMILVKKMQLYSAMGLAEKMREALRQSTHYADSCGIIKYHLYAYEELLDIYKSRKDLSSIAVTQFILDSLNKIYLREQRISSLHNQKENILLAKKEEEIQKEKSSTYYLALTLAVLTLTAFWLVGLYRRTNTKPKEEINQDVGVEKKEIPTTIRDSLSHTGRLDQERLKSLSQRQRDVLECMAEGMSNKEIAEKLFISENTVKFHIKNIYLLLDIKDRKDFLIQFKK